MLFFYLFLPIARLFDIWNISFELFLLLCLFLYILLFFFLFLLPRNLDLAFFFISSAFFLCLLILLRIFLAFFEKRIRLLFSKGFLLAFSQSRLLRSFLFMVFGFLIISLFFSISVLLEVIGKESK